ncbi:hypothetical protein MPDQ_007889 [Monascus purpureus]|uniref:BSD domain-containing protein n=1 Tax=Monascus purpureus TaxID=5098 RepID=A0A507R6T0_MONPU|nr:hypothetical protein MPDQ_007889 [Monascus purpureus]BDD62915.1 hypothetical protein MAP00_007869 [Monascus purpureus]
MDVAYDHIQEEIFKTDSKSAGGSQDDGAKSQQSNLDLSTEFQETFRAFSSSAWGVRIGGFIDNVRKQGESYYEGARQEYAAASEEAVKGISGLRDNIVGRTRGLSLSTAFSSKDEEKDNKDEAKTPTLSKTKDGEPVQQQGDEGSAEAASESGEGFFSRFKAEASRRLKEIEKAEEAADEAILRFGMNISQKLREAVSIVPPNSEEANKGQLLFESKDSEGKRVIHATRFDAQLHVIHSNLENFTKDPVSDEWPTFKTGFNVDSKTNAIATDLETYPELRSVMEKLVPEKVEYADFWCRYYFLRLVVETEEKKRRELLKGAVDDEEEVGWDDDSDSESESPSTPQVKANKTAALCKLDKDGLLKPSEPRRSNDQQSQADSESSYDLVSGTTSRAPESPKEKTHLSSTAEDSDEEDWE